MFHKLTRYPRKLRGFLNRRGMGLPMIIGALVVLSLFTGAMMTVTVQTLNAVNNGEKIDRARYAAMSGIQNALNRLNSPGGNAWAHAHPSTPSAYRQNPGETWEDVMQVTFADQPDVQALVTVYNNTDYVLAPDFRNDRAPDGTTIPPGHIYICSAGMIGGKKKIELSTVGTMVSVTGFRFTDALFADGDLKFESGLLDVFDSNRGRTDPPSGMPSSMSSDYAGLDYYYAEYLDPSQGNKLKAGVTAAPAKGASIGTNRAADNALSLGTGPDQAVMHGNLTTGGGAANEGGNSVRLGDTNPGTNTKKIPKVFAPAADSYVPLDTGAGNYTPASGSTVNLTSGQTYYVAANMTLDNVNLQVTGSGVVNLYVQKDATIKNSSLNWNNKPRNLQIYLVDTGEGKVTVEQSKGAFLMAGGGSEVNIDEKSEIFGAVQAGKVSMKNSKFHYDLAVESLSVGASDFSAEHMFGGTSSTSDTVLYYNARGELPPPAGPAPAPAPVPAPGPGPAPAPVPSGCGCGCGCGCLMAEMQCV